MPAESTGAIVAPSEYQIETPQIGLRFEERKIDGRTVKILQQCWGVVTYRPDPFGADRAVSCDYVWRDIPCVKEGE